jgi:hypothetical protein
MVSGRPWTELALRRRYTGAEANLHSCVTVGMDGRRPLAYKTDEAIAAMMGIC